MQLKECIYCSEQLLFGAICDECQEPPLLEWPRDKWYWHLLRWFYRIGAENESAN